MNSDKGFYFQLLRADRIIDHVVARNPAAALEAFAYAQAGDVVVELVPVSVPLAPNTAGPHFELPYRRWRVYARENPLFLVVE